MEFAFWAAGLRGSRFAVCGLPFEVRDAWELRLAINGLAASLARLVPSAVLARRVPSASLARLAPSAVLARRVPSAVPARRRPTAAIARRTLPAVVVALVWMLFVPQVRAQGLAAPLTIQGTEQWLEVGAAARGMGGAHVGSRLGAASAFFDPAGLALLDAVELRAGVASSSAKYEQRQEWLPNRFYVEMSLILENNPAAVNKPFDAITPDWSRSHSETRPALAVGALPIRLGSLHLVAGLGYAPVIDLDHYFQNNNVLDPNLGQMRPAPIPRVMQGDSLQATWYQHRRERTGLVSAITPALAIRISDAFSVGGSVSVLSGSSDDMEARADRGVFMLRYNNNLSLDPASFSGSWTGSSTYGGTYATISGRYATNYFTFGAALRTPFELERAWSRNGSIVPGESAAAAREGTDVIEMPMMISLGVSILPADRWLVSASVDRRDYAGVTYRPDGVTELSPWLAGNAARAGVQFQATSWLALRGGYRDVAQTFAPEGAGLMDDPVRSEVLSAGLSLTYSRFGVDVAFEQATTKYEDRWLSNVNFNEVVRRAVVFEGFVRF